MARREWWKEHLDQEQTPKKAPSRHQEASRVPPEPTIVPAVESATERAAPAIAEPIRSKPSSVPPPKPSRRGPPAPESPKAPPPPAAEEAESAASLPTLESMLSEARANRIAMQTAGTAGHRDLAQMTACETRLVIQIDRKAREAESDEERLVKSRAWSQLRDRIVGALEPYPEALAAVGKVLS